MWRLLVFCFLGLIGVLATQKEDYRHVTLEGLGEVKGMKYWDGEFYEFYGVPYAIPPKGRDRYKVRLW